jgi:hypothetical protein
MTPAQNKQATDFLQGHVNQPCSKCGSSIWSVLGLTVTELDTVEKGKRMVPLVLVGCDTCFSVTIHAAHPMGVVTESA